MQTAAQPARQSEHQELSCMSRKYGAGLWDAAQPHSPREHMHAADHGSVAEVAQATHTSSPLQTPTHHTSTQRSTSCCNPANLLAEAGSSLLTVLQQCDCNMPKLEACCKQRVRSAWVSNVPSRVQDNQPSRVQGSNLDKQLPVYTQTGHWQHSGDLTAVVPVLLSSLIHKARLHRPTSTLMICVPTEAVMQGWW